MKIAFVALVLLAGVAFACGGSTGPSGGGGSGASDIAAPAEDAPRSGEASQSSASVETKVVVRSTIAIDIKDVRGAYDLIAARTRDLGGYVADATLTDGSSRPTASLRLRVPAARNEELLASLRGLSGAKVRSEQTQATEVTAEFTDLESRLRNLQVSEAQYQALVSRAGTISEIVTVSAKLDEVRAQIEETQGRLNLLTNQTSFATVSVTLAVAPVAGASGVAKPYEVFVDALEASWTVAIVVVDMVVVALVAVLWLAPLGIVGVVGWRLFGRRLRAVYARVSSW
ncbi:MAG TPA: DUF4349 domain-containing protein [Dehalococcoidia bacterium]|nr:DUF4349 domain-containing protein [Dehalococcoidia bacterium]